MINNLIFWGVRGSFPIAANDLIKYGGNTSCISLQIDEDTIIVFDAGSGLKNLGTQIAKQYKGKLPEIHLLISHFMWDHIMGIPFFRPLYKKKGNINIYSAYREDHFSLKEIFAVQHSRDYFHVDFIELPARINFYSIKAYHPFRIKSAIVTPVVLNHADITYGYIVDFKGKRIAYICDTAPFHTQFLGTLPNPKFNDMKYLAYIREKLFYELYRADIVYFDAHFNMEEYTGKHHWGHATPDYALEVAQECEVYNLFLGHHAPEHNDDFMDKLVKQIKGKNTDPYLNVFGAKENMTVKIVSTEEYQEIQKTG